MPVQLNTELTVGFPRLSVVGKIRKTQDIYCSTHDYRVVDISTGQIGIVSGMFLRHTTAKDW
jgi:hypothetical protein